MVKSEFWYNIDIHFDTFVTEKYAPFVLHLEFSVKCKISIKESKAEFMQKGYLVLM